ncbi:MAG TPA: RlmE family RNA methyltransferase [Thermoplasmata archaeon]|nr:RlmE family RNA methyltransferase [Thermoplasmata archaeon]
MPRRFVAERRRDPYYRAAQRDGLRSRAAFKLAYLDDRYHLLRPGARVLDLGAAPGGWSVVAAARVAPRGHVVAVDLRPIEPIAGVTVVRGRVGDPALRARLGTEPFDLVLSDLSPRISGAYATDHARSIGLVREALALANEVLRAGGAFVAKAFDGDLLAELEAELAQRFAEVRRTKPPASREPSSEIYVVGLGRRTRRAAPPSGGRDPVPPGADI